MADRRGPRIGVLALQGDFPEHRAAVDAAAGSGSARFVRSPKDLGAIDALLLPGGESTAIASLLSRSGLWDPLREHLSQGLPALGTCAGLILLAKEIEASEFGRDPPTLGALNVTVRRNDYGRQVESFEGPVEIEGLDDPPFHGVFIRAPRIVDIRTPADPIARRGEEIVGVRQGRVWGLTFHPELSGDPRLLRMFVSQVVQPSLRSQAERGSAEGSPPRRREGGRSAAEAPGRNRTRSARAR